MESVVVRNSNSCLKSICSLIMGSPPVNIMFSCLINGGLLNIFPGQSLRQLEDCSITNERAILMIPESH